MISYVAVDSSAAAPIDVQIEPRHIASARGVRDRSERGPSYPNSVRSRKARALLAFLAMKPDYRASREELATLFWGDNPDALARHSLRQCLISLRQDLRVASEILTVDREAIGLRAQFVSVDARTFMSLARSAGPDELTRAAEDEPGT